jgi:hypothetical protein
MGTRRCDCPVGKGAKSDMTNATSENGKLLVFLVTKITPSPSVVKSPAAIDICLQILVEGG